MIAANEEANQKNKDKRYKDIKDMLAANEEANQKEVAMLQPFTRQSHFFC